MVFCEFEKTINKAKDFMSGTNLRKETLYLYIIQITNIVLPLVTIPYLTNIFGTEYYGKFSFSQVISMLATFIVDFGFNFSAARLIGFNKDDQSELNKIFSNVQFIKFIFLILVSILGLCLYFLFDDNNVDGDLFLIGILSSVSSIFMPYWFFQGMGKNSLISLVNLIVRIVTICTIFILVKDTSDVVLAAALQLFSPLFSGVILIFYIIKKDIIIFSFSRISFSYGISLIKESFHNFSASFMTLGFTYLNPLLIKYFMGDSALGIYSLAERIANVLRQMYIPLAQVNFSNICSFYKKNDIYSVTKVIRKIIIIFLSITFVALLGNYALGGAVFKLLFGSGYGNLAIIKLHTLVSIMIFTQFIISLSIALVNLIVIPSGFSFFLKRVYLCSFIIYLCCVFPMMFYFGLNGVAMTISLVEFSVVALLYKFVKEKNLLNSFLN